MIKLNITDRARDYLNKIEGDYFYIGLKKSGCSGFSYEMKKIKEEDVKELSLKNNIRRETINSTKIAIPENDILYLQGMEIDFVKEGLNQRIAVTNPQAQNSCGCGSSFALKAI